MSDHESFTIFGLSPVANLNLSEQKKTDGVKHQCGTQVLTTFNLTYFTFLMATMVSVVLSLALYTVANCGRERNREK